MTAPLSSSDRYDVAVIGGGPAGATAAAELAAGGANVILVERGDRIKPCGGAIPPLVLREFDVADDLLTAHIGGARITAPSGRKVEMAIGDGFVGMVDREHFDPWLRRRAERSGAEVMTARLTGMEATDGAGIRHLNLRDGEGRARRIAARLVIGADGANSTVRREAFGASYRPPYVFAYHEIVASPPGGVVDAQRCDVHYDGDISPDFYGWVFPHGPVTSVGVGSAVKGFDLKLATQRLRARAGLADAPLHRAEGAPLPLRPLRRWDDGANTLLVGDAAGTVAPASGEGIYYSMLSGRLAAEAGVTFLRKGDARVLGEARRRFMRSHGRVFFVLGAMQGFWYRSDRRRERFAAICADRDVQRLTWQSYLDKRIVWSDPLAHLRVFFKDLAHVVGLAVR